MLSLEELHLRAALFRAIHRFFSQHNFLCVDTPIRQPVVLPESNIQPIRSGNFYLQTSPELCMKRLVSRGSGNIYQICPCFRKEELGRHHLEEFTMLEWYRSDADYFNLMSDCEALLGAIAHELTEHPPGLLPQKEKKGILDTGFLASPWQRLTVQEAFSGWSPVALPDALSSNNFDEILVEHIEPRLGISRPTFLYDYPAQLASLARKREEDQDVAERFELYMHGVEIANGFSELTDPEEQRKRFAEEILSAKRSFFEHLEMPEKFLEDLGGMHQTAGIALGVDRLFMLILGKNDVNAAVTFSPWDL